MVNLRYSTALDRCKRSKTINTWDMRLECFQIENSVVVLKKTNSEFLLLQNISSYIVIEFTPKRTHAL